MNAKKIVIDSSVALKWQLRDEIATTAADSLLDDFLTGMLELYAPTIFDYEIANALKVATGMDRLTDDEALAALNDFNEYDIQKIEFHEIQTSAFKLACQFKQAIYDCAYLAAASMKGIGFYTGDKKLFNALRHQISWIKWIGDYSFDDVPGQISLDRKENRS